MKEAGWRERSGLGRCGLSMSPVKSAASREHSATQRCAVVCDVLPSSPASSTAAHVSTTSPRAIPKTRARSARDTRPEPSAIFRQTSSLGGSVRPPRFAAPELADRSVCSRSVAS
jgi:hypothetical protein